MMLVNFLIYLERENTHDESYKSRCNNITKFEIEFRPIKFWLENKSHMYTVLLAKQYTIM